MGLRDRRSLGRSDIVPFVPNESNMARHARRRGSACQNRELVEWWALAAGLQLIVTNQDHHWRVVGDRVYVEWWPSSAKLVFNKKYRHGHHCHDHEQMISAVECMMRKRKVGPYAAEPDVHQRLPMLQGGRQAGFQARRVSARG